MGTRVGAVLFRRMRWRCFVSPSRAFSFFYWLLKVQHSAAMFSTDGLLLPYHPAADFGVLAQLFTPSPVLALTLLSTLCICLFLVVVGAFMRTAGSIALLLYIYEWFLSLHQLSSSFDRLFLFILAVLIFSGADNTFSWKMWWRHGSALAWKPASVLPLRIIALQIAATYFGVGWQKMWLPDWQSGEILSYSLLGPWASPAAYSMVRLNLPISFYDWSVWLVKIFEFSLPFGLWVPRWQWWFFAGGAIFHISIAVLLEIWWFLVLIPAYVVFLPPERVHSFFQRRFPGIWKI